MVFGNRLKKLRKEKGLRQEDLANIINVHRATIGKYETNERFPDKETLEKIADYFDVSIDYLFGRTNIKNFIKAEKDFLKSREHHLLNLEGLPKDAIAQIEDYVKYIKNKYLNDETLKDK